MASTKKAAPCLMCLDKPAVRTVENCRHSFCEACISSYRNDNDDIACPACKGQCGQTGGQVETDVICEEGRTPRQLKPKSIGGTARESGKGDTEEAFCKICFYRGKTVRATKVCVDCKNIPMCPSCVQEHRKKKTTKNHVTAAVIKHSSNHCYCQTHGELTDMYCKTCSVEICCICSLLEHAEHEMEPLTDITRREAEAIQTALEFEQGRLTRLQLDETYLQESKATAQDMEDTLIKAIEDHTEKVIEEALTNKETLKKKVRSTFGVIQTLEKWLGAIPEMLDVCKGIIAKVERVLYEEAELNSAYVEKLGSLKQDLEELKSGEADYDKEKETYKEAYKKLCKVPMKFYPRSPNMNSGGFVDLKLGPRCDAGGSCVCETCQKRVAKLPHKNRVDECFDMGTCTCGTCGSEFDRSELSSDGCCNKYVYGRYCGTQIACPYYT